MRAPRPGTRSRSSRGAVLTSTGKRPPVAQRPCEFRVDVEIEHPVDQGRQRISSVENP